MTDGNSAVSIPSWVATATPTDAKSHGLRDAEFTAIKQALGREINLVELGICSALFSEHCSYKSTKIHLRTLPTTGPRVLVGPGENACVVDDIAELLGLHALVIVV